jgi:Glucose / Sorbosone dehydrogenase
MLRLLLLSSFALLYIRAQQYCSNNCLQLCQFEKDTEYESKCKEQCHKACGGKQHSPPQKDPYFRTEFLFELPINERITGGDGPCKPSNADYYFTTLSGKLYHYVSTTGKLDVIYTVDPQKLSTGLNKGLYGVTIDRDYNKNRHMYLHYSVVLQAGEQKDYIIQEDPTNDLVDILSVNHFNVIEQLIHDTYNAPTQVAVLKRIPQFTAKRSGGWIQSFVPAGLFSSGARLLFAIGGNSKEDILLARHAPFLSTIHSIVPSRPDIKDEMWASGIRNPISCSATSFKIGDVYCLLETVSPKGTVNGTALYRLKSGINYGSENFQKSCTGLACEQQRNSFYTKDALINFPNTSCAVSSIFTYTGHDMPRYKNTLLVTRDSCFDRETRTFTEVQIMYVAYNSINGEYKATPMSTSFQQRYLIDVKLLGADWKDAVMISGVSIVTGKTVVQELIPDRAGKTIDI